MSAPPRLMVATPAYAGVLHLGHVSGLLDTVVAMRERGFGFHHLTVDGMSLLPFVRNQIAAVFLSKPGFTDLLFVDADIAFTAEDVLKLLSHDVDCVCAIYRSKGDGRPPAWDFEPLADREGRSRRDPATGLVEIKSASAGFLRVRRGVFERLMAEYPESRFAAGSVKTDLFDPRFYHDFFPARIEGGRPRSEDWFFSARWRGIGGRIWCDPGIKLGHVGRFTYTGDPVHAFDLPPAG